LHRVALFSIRSMASRFALLDEPIGHTSAGMASVRPCLYNPSTPVTPVSSCLERAQGKTMAYHLGIDGHVTDPRSFAQTSKHHRHPILVSGCFPLTPNSESPPTLLLTSPRFVVRSIYLRYERGVTDASWSQEHPPELRSLSLNSHLAFRASFPRHSSASSAGMSHSPLAPTVPVMLLSLLPLADTAPQSSLATASL
jgi:hypothetical protein